MVLRGIDERAINGGTWNKWNLGYLASGEGSEKPPHNQAPVF